MTKNYAQIGRSVCRLLFVIILSNTYCKMDQTSSKGEKSSGDLTTITRDSLIDYQNIKYAKNFSILNYGSYKVAHVHYRSEQRGLFFDQKIVLVPRGKPLPKLIGDINNAWVVEVPIKTVAANDDGEITRLKTLNLTENIIAMGGGGIYDTELRKRWEAKQIASIGYSFHSPPQPEIILLLKPDLLLLYSFNHQRLESMRKLREFGINAVPQFAWAEPSFLGKAEWIKFSALFFNKEEEANEIFNVVVDRCE